MESPKWQTTIVDGSWSLDPSTHLILCHTLWSAQCQGDQFRYIMKLRVLCNLFKISSTGPLRSYLFCSVIWSYCTSDELSYTKDLSWPRNCHVFTAALSSRYDSSSFHDDSSSLFPPWWKSAVRTTPEQLIYGGGAEIGSRRMSLCCRQGLLTIKVCLAVSSRKTTVHSRPFVGYGRCRQCLKM